MVDVIVAAGKPKFDLGSLFLTAAVNAALDAKKFTHEDLSGILFRHIMGDWGDMSQEDKDTNDLSVTEGDRILSAYELGGEKVWVITEADRSGTTVLYPDDY